MPKAIETFKGSKPALKGKIFSIGSDQASKCDDIFKSILGYVAKNYDHRVHAILQHKEKLVGKKLLNKPSASTKMDDAEEAKTVLDKDGEDWMMYQIKLKKYVDCLSNMEDGVQQVFNIILGQCTPEMEQTLEAITNYKIIKEKADSIVL